MTPSYHMHSPLRIAVLSCLVLTLPSVAGEQDKTPIHFGFGSAPHSNIGHGPLGAYATMSRAELKKRFHQDLYDGEDPFARANAMSAMLERRLLRRGMTKKQVSALLGKPTLLNITNRPEESPFPIWRVGILSSSVDIYFDAQERVSKIYWHLDRPEPDHPDRSREY